MPKVNVYLPDELADAVRRLDLPLSNICQQALQHAVDRIEMAESRSKSGIFERFSPASKAAVVAASEAARELLHNYVGTEHLLAGIAASADDPVAHILHERGVTGGYVKDAIIENTGKGAQAPGSHLPFTPRAKSVLELSLRESLKTASDRIGTEHLLLALIAEEDGLAAHILREKGISSRDIELRLINTERASRLWGAVQRGSGVMGLLDRRLQQLRDEMAAEFVELREQLESERARTDQLREALERTSGGDEPELKKITGKGTLRCSFCSKKQKDVKKLIAGPGVYICDECLTLCNEIVEEER